jgi:hypothetical protein
MKTSKALAAVWKVARENAPDALMLAGAAGMAYGAWLWTPAAGWIVGGAFAVAVGLAWAGSRK